MTAILIQGSFSGGLGTVTPQLIWLAQSFEDNLGSNLQGAWDNFIQSGQVWALLIGFVVGYIFRSLTAY